MPQAAHTARPGVERGEDGREGGSTSLGWRVGVSGSSGSHFIGEFQA